MKLFERIQKNCSNNESDWFAVLSNFSKFRNSWTVIKRRKLKRFQVKTFRTNPVTREKEPYIPTLTKAIRYIGTGSAVLFMVYSQHKLSIRFSQNFIFEFWSDFRYASFWVQCWEQLFIEYRWCLSSMVVEIRSFEHMRNCLLQWLLPQ